MKLADHDLCDLRLFEDGFPHEIFRLHRKVAPIWWHPAIENTADGVGFWSVATHAESLEVMRDPRTFSSVGGPGRPSGGTILPDNIMAGRALNMMDDPRHRRVRRLVSEGFRPRTVRRLEKELRARTRRLVDEISAGTECDFLVKIAAELPLQAISILLGVPEEDRGQVFEWIDYTFDFRGKRAFEQTEESAIASAKLAEYGGRLMEAKRATPADDMLSIVLHAELPDEDPPRLTEEELFAFFFLLFAAGADTTRNATAGGLLELTRHPDQLKALSNDPSLLPLAIEEMVRWTSPAAYNRRTLTRDVEFHGHAMHAGDKIAFWEASANRDELVFHRSMEFDIRRNPNPHIGFGHGVHHCLGANLARLEMTVIFEEVFGRLEAIELAGEPEWTRSNKHTGIRHLPIRFRARSDERHVRSDLVMRTQHLVDRVRDALAGTRDITEKRMFGGHCFLHRGNMCCGTMKDGGLMVRPGEERAAVLAKRAHARICDFTGRPMKSIVLVDPPGFRTKAALQRWVDEGLAYASSLPAKKK